MNLISFHPIKPLLEAWKRFRLRRDEKPGHAAGEKAKSTQATQSRHRHAAFSEFP